MKNLTSSNPVRSPVTRAAIFAITAFGALLGAAAPAHAQQALYVASNDWRHWIGTWDDPIEARTLVDEMFFMRDFIVFDPNARTPYGIHAGGVAFFSAGVAGIPNGIVQVTTVYGIDLTPGETRISMTGFNALDPEMAPLTGETIYSRFGTTYESVASLTLPLGSIGSILPGHDLSWFAGGDPNSILYAFQTYAPLDEFLAPTPGPLACLGLGALFAARRRR